MPKKIALLIGVSECGVRIPPHSEAANNVAAMQRVLQDPNLGDFDEVESLLNPDLETMQKAIQEVFARCGVTDLALLFFSGHGIIDEDGHLYFTTSITAQNDFQATAVQASFVQQQLSISDAERQVVILDCGYSGAFADGWQTKSVKVDINQELGKRGRIILTSSTATQTSFEQETASLSPYTQYLVEGIETGAADRDGAGLIYVRELHNYAKGKVQDIQPQMEPDIILDEKDFDIVLTVLLNQDPNNDPEAEYLKIESKYRKIVENYGRVGEIPQIVNYTLDKKQKTFGIAVDKDAPDDLISERDVDYTNLRDLLKAGQWKEADQETLAVILKAANREEEEYLNVESIENFPCTDLYTIDQLWIKYSGGQFGFSLQKEIWLGVGGEFIPSCEQRQYIFDPLLPSSWSDPTTPSYYNTTQLSLSNQQNVIYEKFGLRVGWRDRKGVKLIRGWRKYEDLDFSLTWAPVGHLPTMAGSKTMSFEELNFWWLRSEFFSRMDACWL